MEHPLRLEEHYQSEAKRASPKERRFIFGASKLSSRLQINRANDSRPTIWVNLIQLVPPVRSLVLLLILPLVLQACSAQLSNKFFGKLSNKFDNKLHLQIPCFQNKPPEQIRSLNQIIRNRYALERVSP